MPAQNANLWTQPEISRPGAPWAGASKLMNRLPGGPHSSNRPPATSRSGRRGSGQGSAFPRGRKPGPARPCPLLLVPAAEVAGKELLRGGVELDAVGWPGAAGALVREPPGPVGDARLRAAGNVLLAL